MLGDAGLRCHHSPLICANQQRDTKVEHKVHRKHQAVEHKHLRQVDPSGVVIAGVVVWYLSRALAATGALERFESGRSKARV